MGIYNGAGKALPQMLRDNICPLCKGSMKPENNYQDLKESDSFEYICNSCNPKKIISLSGGLVSVLENKLKGNEDKITWVIKAIRSDTERDVFPIIESMFD